MKHKIRPFEKSFEVFAIRDPDEQVKPAGFMKVSGEIRDGRFLVKIGQADPIPLPTTEGGADDFGVYAFIEDQNVELPFDWRLSVKDGDDDPGCCVAFQELTAPGTMPRTAIDIYFSDTGNCNGGGTNSPSKPEHEFH